MGTIPRPRPPLVLLAVVFALLTALVFSFSSSRITLSPAPLAATRPGCAASRVFVPTNVTRFPDAGLEALPVASRNRALLRVNMEPCNCGCLQSVVACRLSNPECAASRKLLGQAISPENN